MGSKVFTLAKMTSLEINHNQKKKKGKSLHILNIY